MKIGTKTILFGAHCFFIHPWYVALAWWKLYGFPWDLRLWVAFFVHDLGYWGKPNIDGPEGELHPYWGACVMGALFGKEWFDFTLYHSRYLAKRNNARYSKLCVADKYAICLTPAWLYLPMVKLTGEIGEYMQKGRIKDPKEWHHRLCEYMEEWVSEHRDLRPDNWTRKRQALNSSGVYQ